jgi:hypothetical protein
VSDELSSLVDREGIRDRIIRLARGEDRRDAKAIGAAFWPEATTDFGIFAGSFDEYLAWVVPGAPGIPVTQHVLGQTLIDLKGEVALTETHVTAYHRVDFGTAEHDVVIAGRYLDRFTKRDGEWRIVRRVMLYDWVRDHGVSADLAQGVLGTPFHGDHYAGRSARDHSEIFFADRESARP